MTGRFWKDAATLIVVGRAAHTRSQVNVLQEADYNLLFLKRSQKSSFMPSAFVYPGGVTEPSDFSLEWLDIFKKYGYTKCDLLKQFRHSAAPLPEFYANQSADMLLPEIGFRITALRETFEECGLLLTNHMSNDSLEQIDYKQWSSSVHENASKFMSLFKEFGGCPAIWDLHEWSGWLTPTGFLKRFDTAFYITFIDEISKVAVDKTEVVDMQVSSPQGILKQWQDDSLFLPPPQAYEVSRFLHFNHYDDLKRFAVNRGKNGLQRWCPVKVKAADGVLTVFPGDDLYPENSDHTEDADMLTLNSSMKELRNAAKCLHRGEIVSVQDIYFAANITPKFGHVLPVNYRDLYGNSKSNL